MTDTASPSLDTDLSTEKVASKIDEAIDKTSAAAKERVDKIGSTASKFADDAREVAGDAASRASGMVDRASQSLRSAADSLRDGSFQERTFGQLAATLADASDAIRDKDLAQIANDTKAFAKRNPILFIGGAALLGYAVSRMVSHSGDRS